jgi:outer membrane protein assembly factor BamD
MRHTAVIVIFLSLLAVSCAGDKSVRPALLSPEEAFDKGNQKLEAKLYDEARQLFDEVKRRDVRNTYAPLAQLRIADSYVMDDQPALAVEQYRKFLDDYPTHKYASYSLYSIGVVYYNLIKGPDRGYGAAVKALDAFQELEAAHPRNPYRSQVREKMEHARKTIADHEYEVGDFYYRGGSCEGAVIRLEGMLRDFPDYGRAADALYRIALCQKALGHEDEARSALLRLEERYPESELAAKAREALGAKGKTP